MGIIEAEIEKKKRERKGQACQKWKQGPSSQQEACAQTLKGEIPCFVCRIEDIFG